MKKLSQRIALKSLNAALASLEIYNKPDCNYREENFCILVINAYELLFKAKIISDAGENLKAIYVYENKKTKNGVTSKQKTIKRNRIGEAFTIDLYKCVNILKNANLITSNIKENIDILIEIRDNAIHLINNSNDMKTKLYSICAASISNYTKLMEKWFINVNLEQYNFFITPLNFSRISGEIESVNLNVAQKNFLSYIELASNISSPDDEYDIFIKIDVNFIKSNIDESVLLAYASEGKKINIELSEEMFKKMYPYDNGKIIKMIKKKNANLKINHQFNIVKKELQKNEICCKARYLDFINKKGTPKFYYNAGFVDILLKKINS